MASRNKQNNVHPHLHVHTSKVSLETVLCLKCKQWRIYWINQGNMSSDTHNNLQIHHRVFIAMTNSASTASPPITTPPCSLWGGVGEFLFVYCGKPFMHLRVRTYTGIYFFLAKARRVFKLPSYCTTVLIGYSKCCLTAL